MTVQQLLSGVIYAGVLAGALTGIGTFLHFAAVRPMRSFLRKEIAGPLGNIEGALQKNTEETTTLALRLTEHLADAAGRDTRIEEISRRLTEHAANGGHTRHG